MNDPLLLLAETVDQLEKSVLYSRSTRPVAVTFHVTEALPPLTRTMTLGSAVVVVWVWTAMLDERKMHAISVGNLPSQKTEFEYRIVRLEVKDE